MYNNQITNWMVQWARVEKVNPNVLILYSLSFFPFKTEFHHEVLIALELTL